MDEQLAYLAGFIDGEGSIAVGLNRTGKGVRRWYLRFSCHQLDPRPLRLMAERWGGTVRLHHDPPRKRQIFEWSTSSRQAAAAITELRPLLIVKADEASVALEFQALVSAAPAGRRPHLTPEEEDARNDCYLRLRALKQRNYEEM